MLFFFFFNDTATTEIYTLSLHDALPILLTVAAVGGAGAVRGLHGGVARDERRGEPARRLRRRLGLGLGRRGRRRRRRDRGRRDRKSTRLNSSHANISYAVFCLKKKKSQRQSRVQQVAPTGT